MRTPAGFSGVRGAPYCPDKGVRVHDHRGEPWEEVSTSGWVAMEASKEREAADCSRPSVWWQRVVAFGREERRGS